MKSNVTFYFKELLAPQSVLALLLSLGAAFLTIWISPSLPSASNWLFFTLHVSLIILCMSVAISLLALLYENKSAAIRWAYIGFAVGIFVVSAAMVQFIDHTIAAKMQDEQPWILYGVYAVVIFLVLLGAGELTRFRSNIAEFIECRRGFLENRSHSAS